MKAVLYRRYGSPEVLELSEVDKPTPKDNEVLIRIRATTVTSEDCTFRKGRPLVARSATGFFRPKKAVLGTECSGVVEAVGKAVERFRAGDEVFASTGPLFGSYAEYICLPQNAAISFKPENMDFMQAAALCGGSLTALPFLRDKGKIRKGHDVVVYGASGSVGTAAVQLAKHFGANVVALCSGANRELVRSLGADSVYDYTKEDFTKKGGSFDIVFDAVGKSSFSECKSSLKEGGIYLSTVLSPGIVVDTLRTSMFGAKKAMISFTGLRPLEERRKDLLYVKELAETGKMRAVIDRSYPLGQITEAHRYVDQGHKKGSVIITLDT